MNALDAWNRMSIADVRWRIDPDCEPLQKALRAGPVESQLDDWLRSGVATVVKHGPHRTVYRLTLPGLTCYLKHNRIIGWRGWLRELVRGCKSIIECHKAQQVAQRGLPTGQPLAVGERGRGYLPGESYLVTRALDDVEPLSTFVEHTLPAMPASSRPRLRRLLTAALAEFMARLHDTGIRHSDLHAGNILVRVNQDRPELFLVDLHEVSLGRPLTWAHSRDNLVVLHRWGVLRASQAECLRFWKAYWQARTRISRPWSLMRLLAADVENRTWSSNCEQWRRRDQRCLSSNRQFQRVRSSAASGHAVRELDPATLEQLLADPDAPFRANQLPLLKDSPSSTVAEMTVKINGIPRPVIYKRFRKTAWHEPLVNLLRPAPALRSWINGQGLISRVLPTPLPLLILQRRMLGLHRDGYLLMEKVENGVNLHELVRRLDTLPPRLRRPLLANYIEAVARILRHMHRCRLAHRDLKADNILVTDPALKPTGESASLRESLPSCWLIDLVGMTPLPHLSRRRRIQNLTRLNASFHSNASISRADRLRFLLIYLRSAPGARENWRTWWKDIAAATQQKVARNLRKQRVLG